MLDRVVETGRPQISDLIIGAVLARPILSVGVPVFREGKIAFVLAMGLGPELLSASVERAEPTYRLERRHLRPQVPDCRTPP